jgi:electron transport complex protein RnfC
MGAKTHKFHGGVHPHEHKLTAGQAIEDMPAPARAIFPVSQHIGAPAKPVVAIGDRVLRGQILAEPGGFVSVPIHSSISGEVVAIGDFPHPLGRPIQAIVVENDGKDEETAFEPADPAALDSAAIKKRIAAGGLVGMGGATFPTHVKLSPPPDKTIDTVILNGAECEPFLTADHRTMLEMPDLILKGMDIIMKSLGVTRGLIGIENNKPDAIELLKSKAAAFPNIEVIGLHVQYPQGSEKHLIKSLTGREVPPGKLPMDVKVVVQNVTTAVMVWNAVALGKPVMDRVITVSGFSIKNPKNVRARIGTPFFEVIDYCGGLTDDVSKVVMGGPMMGMAQFTLSVPVIKGTSGILGLPGSMVQDVEPRACVRCARCVDACPMGLLPNELVDAVDAEDWDRADRLGILSCIECGSCAYACLGKRPIVQVLKRGKAEVMKMRQQRDAEKKKQEEAAKAKEKE